MTNESSGKDDISALRSVLFETLRSLSDKKNPMDVERARAINDTAQTIINSAKVEVDFVRAAGANQGTGFIPLPAPDAPKNPATSRPSPGLTVHKLL